MDRRASGSALFARSAAGYWDRFFVPGGDVADPDDPTARLECRGNACRRRGRPEPGASPCRPTEASANSTSPTRARRGSLRPTSVRRGVARFSGVQRIGDRVALFGEEGLEIVARKGGAYRLVVAIDRGSVGAVSGVEEVDGKLLVAGTRGLLRMSLDGGNIERIIERPLRGIARSGETLLLIDDQWVYAGSARDPRPTGFCHRGRVRARTGSAQPARRRWPCGRRR